VKPLHVERDASSLEFITLDKVLVPSLSCSTVDLISPLQVEQVFLPFLSFRPRFAAESLFSCFFFFSRGDVGDFSFFPS